MPIDPAIYDIMRGVGKEDKKIDPVTSSYNAVLESAVQKEVNARLAEEDPSHTFFNTKEHRAKLEQEIRGALDLSEFGKHVTAANQIFRNEGHHFLENEEYDDLIKDLNVFNKNVKEFDLKTLNNETLNQILTFSRHSLASILAIGIGKFSQGLLEESFSIFAFLTSLSPDEPDYWYRFGLVAQKCEHYDLALRAYAVTTILASDFIGSRIYSAQCYLISNRTDDAIIELEEAKLLLVSNPNTVWQQKVADIENLLLEQKK